MNKTVIWSVVILAAAAVLCFFIYSQNTRYVMLSAGNRVYKTDRRTGKSVLLVGRRELPVEPVLSESPESLEESAIRLAKKACTLDPSATNEHTIKGVLEKTTGHLDIIGWQAKQTDEQTFVVTYSFDLGDGARTWGFEVKPEESLVRNITGDVSLEKKYGFRK